MADEQIATGSFSHTLEQIDAAVDAVADKASQADLEALAEAVEGKQDELTFDSTPTANSDNPVKSKGIKNYVDSAVTSETTAREAESGAVANSCAKNLSRATFLPNNIFGVAFTVNADETVVANGTATASAALQSTTFKLKAGTYTFSCSENPQRDTTYDAYVYNVDTSTTIARDNPNDSPGSTFTLAQDSTIRINVRIANGYAANDVVFKPMIRDAAIADATYQPPTFTNEELETECGALANLGAKNMCPYNTLSAAASGTVLSDQPINLPAGTYIMSYTHTATSGYSSIRLLNNGTSLVNFSINNTGGLVKSREFALASPANQLRIYSDTANAYSNIMIRRKEISDASYQPYAPTNRELYEMILALQ